MDILARLREEPWRVKHRAKQVVPSILYPINTTLKCGEVELPIRLEPGLGMATFRVTGLPEGDLRLTDGPGSAQVALITRRGERPVAAIVIQDSCPYARGGIDVYDPDTRYSDQSWGHRRPLSPTQWPPTHSRTFPEKPGRASLYQVLNPKPGERQLALDFRRPLNGTIQIGVRPLD